MTKHERIDLTQFEEMNVTSMPIWYSKIPDLIAELKKSYETIDYLATHAMVTGDFCPMCLTHLDEKCQHIIWDDRGYTTTFDVWNPETGLREQHVHYEQNSLKPRDDGE